MILRVIHNRENPYVMLNKEFLGNKKLSWKAKGLLSYLLSLPDNWKINLGELSRRSKDGAKATRSAVGELIRNGYIVRQQARENGKFRSIDYDVRESPDTVIPVTKDVQPQQSAKRDHGPASNGVAKIGILPFAEKRHAENGKAAKVLSNNIINNESYESRDSPFPKKVFQKPEKPEGSERAIPAKIHARPSPNPEDAGKSIKINGKLYRIWICSGNAREEYLRRTDILPELSHDEADCLERSGVDLSRSMRTFYAKAKALLGEGEFCMLCHEVKNMELEGLEPRKNNTSRFIHFLEEALRRKVEVQT